ncbi:MAG: DUF371 domain-containing protein [Nitrososphaerota archaeon]|nr:DUF371 domain-containing protein [Candidatus Bathyarchaeota archaeon]MDW8048509.1 DUF371 domain-containing protein [Nitrososphaerota archaeon]
MEKSENFIAYGHKLIRSTHRTTLEITKDSEITEKGDCIVAVKSEKACVDLNPDIKAIAKRSDARITIILEIEGEKEIITGKGDPRLTFAHPQDMVVRKSGYICDRTLTIWADKSAADLSRRFVKKLRNPNCIIKVTIIASCPD